MHFSPLPYLFPADGCAMKRAEQMVLFYLSSASLTHIHKHNSQERAFSTPKGWIASPTLVIHVILHCCFWVPYLEKYTVIQICLLEWFWESMQYFVAVSSIHRSTIQNICILNCTYSVTAIKTHNLRSESNGRNYPSFKLEQPYSLKENPCWKVLL